MKLIKIDTRAPEGIDKQKTKAKTDTLALRLKELQDALYAESKHSLLIVLQGMDASGKDGTVSHVFGGVNPLGCQVQAFKVPTTEEASHDFLWRIHPHTPARGMIQIFNRSHYEDVLVPSVRETLPRKLISRRMEYINAFEAGLTDAGTTILKFYLHISEAEQQKRFAERLINEQKNWKYQASDLAEAKYWPEYRRVYEELFAKCSPDIPWHIIPADQNWYRDYCISKLIVETLEQLKPKYPMLDPKKQVIKK